MSVVTQEIEVDDQALSRQVLLARNIRWGCAALGVVAAGALTATSLISVGSLVGDLFSGQAPTWDLIKAPAISLAALTFSQSPAFIANNIMVGMAKREDSELSDAVMKARYWRNWKRGLEATGIIMSPTFFPEGIKGTIASGLPLAGAAGARLMEAWRNSNAQSMAQDILHPRPVRHKRVAHAA